MMIQFRNMMNTSFVITRRIALFLICLTVSNFTWAGFYTEKSGNFARVVVKVEPSAKGKVYADTLAAAKENPPFDPNSTTYSLSIEGTKQMLDLWIFTSEITRNNSVTFNLYAADRTAEYVWAGWYKESGTEPTTMDNPAKVTITATNASNKTNPTTETYTAKWLQPKVTSTTPSAIDLGTITNPTTTVNSEDVQYAITEYVGKENFVMITTPSSFTHSETDLPITSNTYTSSI